MIQEAKRGDFNSCELRFCVRPLGAGQPIDQAVRPIGLEIAPYLVELLARVAHRLAGPGDIGKFGSKFEQAELTAC